MNLLCMKIHTFLCIAILLVLEVKAQVCKSVDDLKLSVMGSSVAFGQGGVGFGYARLYADLLGQRFGDGVGKAWTMTNVSVKGNNTIDVLNRWAGDLLPECGKYVVYGLSLANEGIQSGGQAKFDQFRDNMLMLIQMAHDEGKIPIVINNYTRGNYNETDYSFIKAINLLIHEWDVASVNVLGAVDNGMGRWAAGHSADVGHPNQKGHREFFYTIVTSLFDAIDSGKEQPSWVDGTSMNLGRAVTRDRIIFTPEATLHPFTLSFAIKTTAPGILASFETKDQVTGTIEINKSGVLEYTSPGGVTISGSIPVNDDQWHQVTLSHYFAWGRTFLYTDSKQESMVEESLEATRFSLAGLGAPASVEYSNLLFYRSGMNSQEIEALNQEKMLKSSLEIYAPLDHAGIFSQKELINLAQSTNTLAREEVITSIDETGNDLGPKP